MRTTNINDDDDPGLDEDPDLAAIAQWLDEEFADGYDAEGYETSTDWPVG